MRSFIYRRMGKGKAHKQHRMDEQVRQRFDSKLSAMGQEKLSQELEANIDWLKQTLGQSDDMVMRSFCIGGDEHLRAVLVFLDGMIDNSMIDQFILKATMLEFPKAGHTYSGKITEGLVKFGLPVNEVKEAVQRKQVVSSLLSGDTVFMVQGDNTGLILNTKGWEKRPVSEPTTENIVRGPRNSFTETLRTNTAQIRLQLKDPELRIKNMQVGERSQTNLSLLYIESIANEQIVQEVVRRIEGIKIDAVLDSGYIEQLIEDSHWSPFPLIQNTERPDKATANLLEGKVVILCDGSPFALIAPAVFTQFYHSPEDYYERFLIGTLIRIIRILSMAMALLLPSLYIAFSSFHPEMIPSRLVIAMAAGRSTVPFPSIVEAFLMEITMEVLREASVRLPGPIGPTIGIVGALVVGQAAVEAGIVSPIMVIVVALTTIGSFASPSYSAAISLRMLRFPMMAAAGIFGLYGIMMMLIWIIMHLCSLKSFGIPYMTPITPSRLKDLKDTIVRAPLFWMKNRPSFLKPKDKER